MALHPDLPVLNHGEVTGEWLTQMLAAFHRVVGASVLAVDQRSIGTGQVGENVRFKLTWDVEDPALPVSVVGKFPSPDPTSRAAAQATRTYEREVGFYRDLQSKVAVRTPDIYYVAENLADNSFTLIMEDIKPSAVGDQILGCDADRARFVVSAAADLHGSTWDSGPQLEELSWIDPLSPESLEGRVALYRATFGGFVNRYKSRLSSPVVKNGEWLDENIGSVLTGHNLARCLVHGDFRLDNMLFGDGDSTPPVTVVDWQTGSSGYGPVDVAYFIGAGLLAPERRAHEELLFDCYVDGLATHGVEADRGELWRSYRLGSCSGYIMAVIASQIVGQTDRGDEMFIAMASRHSAQMLDLDVAELVS